MSKKEVLNQVYPDELEYIFEKKREKELKRYMGYLNQIMAVSAAFGGGDAAKDYVQDVMDRIKKLSNNDEYQEESNNKINNWYKEYEDLKEKGSLTEQEKERMAELKQKMDEHIDKEIKKLKGLGQKQKDKLNRRR